MSVPEIRTDPLSGEEVVVAARRAERPNALRPRTTTTPEPAGRCPFCPGNEAETPPETYAIGDADRIPDTPGWRVRVVPNRYPAILPVNARSDVCAARGLNEVVIETPAHDRPWHAVPVDALAETMCVLVDRLDVLAAHPDVTFVSWFKNDGAEAGATQPHPHAQVVALFDVPPLVAAVNTRGALHVTSTGRCHVCALLDRERALGERVIEEAEGFAVLSPYAARLPYEVMIVPPHEGRFTASPEAVAAVLSRTVRRLHAVLDGPAINVVLRAVPLRNTHAPWGHWVLSVLPRLTRFAGFEWMTGRTINPVAPERAARVLRG